MNENTRFLITEIKCCERSYESMDLILKPKDNEIEREIKEDLNKIQYILKDRGFNPDKEYTFCVFDVYPSLKSSKINIVSNKMLIHEMDMDFNTKKYIENYCREYFKKEFGCGIYLKKYSEPLEITYEDNYISKEEYKEISSKININLNKWISFNNVKAKFSFIDNAKTTESEHYIFSINIKSRKMSGGIRSIEIARELKNEDNLITNLSTFNPAITQVNKEAMVSSKRNELQYTIYINKKFMDSHNFINDFNTILECTSFILSNIYTVSS